MKKVFTLLALLVAGSLQVQGAAVIATNYDESVPTQKPFTTAAGSPFLAGGVIQLGTFTSDPTALLNALKTTPSPASWSALVSAFTTFGATNKIGEFVPGLYEAVAQGPINAGNPLIGGNIYTLIGNGATLEASTEAALFRETAAFAVDAPLFNTTANVSSAASLLLFGQAGPSVETALGSAVSAQFAPVVPEPMSATLFLSGLALALRRRRA